MNRDLLADAGTGPWWLVLACALAALPLGWWLRRELTTGDYRMQEEQTGPVPRGSWALVAVLPVVWALLAWRLGGVAGGVLLPAFLVYAWAGVALFWIDADVHRLPSGLTTPLLWSVVGLLAVAALVTGEWGVFARAAICGAGAFVVYFVLVLASFGSFGWGDLVLGSITGLLLGVLGWRHPALAIAAGFVIGSLVMVVRLALRQVTLKSEVAFGPYILLGALWVVVVPS